MRTALPGGTLVAQQVACTILLDALRQYLADNRQRGPGWLSALADERMRTALSSIHQEPARGWTPEQLAHLSGMSRTAFAQKFKKHVGETPMAYITRWRMTLAANHMREKHDTLASVSRSVGYTSESAFCAAFKRQ
jgi:AraC-like DNA-binding protein